MTDTRPTQAQVEAVAEELYGKRWKDREQHAKALIDERISMRLDTARRLVIARRG